MEQTSHIAEGARIDVIGNANNYPLSIVRGLRKIGYDAHLHLITNIQLDTPENRYSEYTQVYPEWIHDWRHLGDILWSSPTMCEAVRKGAAAADALILNYDAVHLGASETRPYFCLLTGFDLLNFANPQKMEDQISHASQYSLEHPPNCHYLRSVAEFVSSQRAAIRQAPAYSFFPTGTVPAGDDLLNSIGVAPQRRLSLLVTEVEKLDFSVSQRSERLQVLYGARLTWDSLSPPFKNVQAYKGTDIFLRGFADFIHQGGQAELILFRKGDHIPQTEALVAELGLESAVMWRDEANQQDYIEAVRNADVVVDSMGTSHLGMVTVDAMSLGRPVIARAPDHRAWHWPEPLPICHASEAEDVTGWLSKLANDQEHYNAIAKRAREFAETHLSPEHAARHIMEALQRPAVNEEAVLFQTLDTCSAYSRKNYDRMVADSIELQARFFALQADLATLQSDHHELNAKYSALGAEYKFLQAEHHTLSTTYSTLWADHEALKFEYMGIKANARRLMQALRRRLKEEYQRLTGK